MGSKTVRLLIVEFPREVWRVVYVAVAAVAIAAGAVTLVDRSSTLLKQLLKQVRDPSADLLKSSHELMTLTGAVTVAVALIATVVGAALALSIPEQMRDFVRLRRLEPRAFQEAGSAMSAAFRGGSDLLGKIIRSAAAGWKTVVRSTRDYSKWRTEIRARAWFLPISFVFCGLALLTVTWLSLAAPERIGWLHPPPIIHALVAPLWNANLAIVLIVLVLTAFVKRVFVDYLADVALYTTADENSEFFATRAAILKEATRRIRFLLNDPDYTAVALAGHSLGSVIGYDAINWLRTEAATPLDPIEMSATLDQLEALTEKLESVDAAKAAGLVSQVRQEIAARSAGGAGEPATAGRPAPGIPIRRTELAKLTTFVTFGSPLNKVLYFFRTKTKVYETVRAHILYETHGFRQSSALLTRDPRIQDPPDREVADNLRWLNVYSPMDPVSARLTFYSLIKESRYWYPLWGWCHTSYWHDRRFYREVLAALDGTGWST